MSDIKAIEFVAELRQVKTMTDGSISIYLNLPEHCREQAKVLLDWHHLEVYGILSLDRLDGGSNGGER